MRNKKISWFRTSRIFLACSLQPICDTPHMTKILLVDDHPIVREGFKRLIERDGALSVVGEAASRLEALALLQTLEPDLLITDISLADGSGMALLRDARERFAALRCIVLSMHDNPAFVAEALALGAQGYVTKAAGSEELIAAIAGVLDGGRYLSCDVRPSSHHAVAASRFEPSPREREVLGLLVRGLVPKAAAVEMGISDKTFYAHRARLLEKLGARNDRDLARVAVELGLV